MAKVTEIKISTPLYTATVKASPIPISAVDTTQLNVGIDFASERAGLFGRYDDLATTTEVILRELGRPVTETTTDQTELIAGYMQNYFAEAYALEDYTGTSYTL